ncbi:MAG TPA: T9SS type A sorting domain-containing protein [Flavipsychrobacter sp.]|nr:T9SS type A sorting domain-containing protein [Flavipsychrobacter sp.]
MKPLLITLLLIGTSLLGKAQGFPQYIVDTNNPAISSIIPYWKPFDLNNDGNIEQLILKKSDFPTMPAQGFITDVFMKIAYNTSAGSKLYGLTVKMGITNMNEYPSNNILVPLISSIEAALTTVYHDSVYTLGTTLPANSWWRLQLPQPFQYSLLPLPGDVPQNLMLQLSQDSIIFPQNFKFNVYGITYNNNYTPRIRLGLKRQNGQLSMVGTGPVHNLRVIGFNGYALSVDDPQKKVPFSVFPNPASDKLHLSNEASGMYEVYNLSGIKVLEGKVKEGEEVNVQNLSPGMYLLRMGERITRFVKE